jgi:hypothetical protein
VELEVLLVDLRQVAVDEPPELCRTLNAARSAATGRAMSKSVNAHATGASGNQRLVVLGDRGSRTKITASAR